MEFYFSERNLAHDKFLQTEIKKNDNGCMLYLNLFKLISYAAIFI